MSATEIESLAHTLAALRRRLRLLFFLHGFGLLLAVAAGGFLLSYGLDRALHLPAPVRLAFLAALSAAAATILYRRVLFPLRKKLDDRDMALAVERRFPELREKVVSALELSRAEKISSPDLVRELQRSAEESLRHLPLREVLNPRRSLHSLGVAAAGLAAWLGAVAADPEAVSIWARRFLGQEVPWPQQTFLLVRFPSSQAHVTASPEGDRMRVEVARGSDLPVRVVAQGTVPDAVFLHLTGGKTRTMLRSGGREFSHLLASIREPMSLWATGGDDQDENPRVDVVPIHLPEIAKIAVTIGHPPYARIPPATREGGAVEGLVGSRVDLRLQSSIPVARGLLRFHQSGDLKELQPLLGEEGLGASFEIASSDRYAVELYNENGLRSPDAGSYPVIAIPDRKPEIRVFAPTRSDLESTPKGRVPLRAEVQDDFGVGASRLVVRVGKEGEGRETALFEAPQDGAPPRKTFLDSGLEISELRVGDRPPHEGEIAYLRFRAADNRPPEPNVAESNEIRVILVSEEEIERRIHDALVRVKESVEALETLQREKMERTADLLAVAESEGKLPPAEILSLRSAAVGQSRVSSSAKAVAGQLLEALEAALYNRLHREANAWIQEYENARRDARGRSQETGIPVPPEEESFAAIESLYAAAQAGRLGVAELPSKLVEMTRLAFALAERDSKEAARELENAAAAVDTEAQKRGVLSARNRQRAVMEGVERLLTMLSEWDNYQTVINQWKELLERQRSIHGRTKEWIRSR